MSTRLTQRRHGMLAHATTIVACLVVVAIAATCAAAEPAARNVDSPASLRHDLDALVAAGAPGVILFLRDGDHTTWLAAGLGDLARKTPMRAENHFKIASLTKTFTATVLLQLVSEGKLSLDDSVQQRLPDVVPNGSKITIRQVLNHTSGLYDFELDPRYLKPYLAGDFAHYWSPRQLVVFGVSHKPLFAPGRGYSYSNTNYVVAQLIIERVTGRTIGAEFERRIFAPLHLRQTSYPTKPGLPSPYAHGYMLLGQPPLTDVTGLSPSLAPGSGGIVSTTDDLATFYRALLSGRLLEPAQMRQMKSIVSERTGKPTAGPGMGLGIGRTPRCGGWGHSAELPGYDVSTAFSENGRRQMILMISQDATTLPKAAYALYNKLQVKAFCGGVPG